MGQRTQFRSRRTDLFADDTIVSHTQQRGISRYFRHILQGIDHEFGEQALVYSKDMYAPGHTRLVRPAAVPGHQKRVVQGLMSSIAVWRTGARVYFSPYFGYATASCAKVYTVYDMIHELFPGYFPPSLPGVRKLIAEKRRCIQSADAIIAISHSTADNIRECYQWVDPAKIATIHLGVDPVFFEATTAREKPTKPYFLYVGHTVLYKNFERLLHAFDQAGLRQDFDLRVVSFGKMEYSEAERELIERFSLQDSLLLEPSASDAELRQLYAGATAYLCPSIYEGFGLPILEAMASGTLVATSQSSSMPEIAGSLGYYFDPVDIESIVECLRVVAGVSGPERHLKIEQGREHAAHFTWNKCQSETNAVFRSLL